MANGKEEAHEQVRGLVPGPRVRRAECQSAAVAADLADERIAARGRLPAGHPL